MLRNPFYSVLALVVHLLSLAVLFLLLRAEFVAAVAGGRLRRRRDGALRVRRRLRRRPDRAAGRAPAHPGAVGSQLRLGGAIVAGALLVELLIALLGTGLQAIDGKGAGYSPGPEAFGTPAYIGKLLLTRFLLAFEVASFLLLIAAVGGVVLARRRDGLEEDDEQRRAHAAEPAAPALDRHDGRGRREARR